MNDKVIYEVIIIGAGHCGLALAYHLEKENISYLLLEQNRPFYSWYQRWDNFNMNTANWMNVLPGVSIATFDNENSRSNKIQVIQYFENWLKNFSPNIETAYVIKLMQDKTSWKIKTRGCTYQTKKVVVAIGRNKINIPDYQFKISDNIRQIHSSNYLSPTQITTKHILIVGAGSSGVQICEDLAKTNNYSITLACSKNKYFSWSYLGISIHRYVKLFKLFNISSKSYGGKVIKLLTLGKGDPATPPKPEVLQKKYPINLTGRLTDIQESVAFFDDNKILRLENITIIWCTGYLTEFNSLFSAELNSKVLNTNGEPKLKSDFESEIPNLYFIGMRFQRLVSSHIIYGAVRDAKVLVAEISKTLFKAQ